MKYTHSNLINVLKITGLALVLTLGVNYVVAANVAYVGPPGPPTDCPSTHVGCNEPINVGANVNGIPQSKIGGIFAGFLGSTAGGWFATNVGIGGKLAVGQNATTSGASALDVDGAVRLRTGASDGKILISDANGNAQWSTLWDKNTIVYKRSAASLGDKVAWCPPASPHLLSCMTVDNQRNDNILLNSECPGIDGPCDTNTTGSSGNVRTDLGSDHLYTEIVQKVGPIYGCLAYDAGHAHKSYSLDLVCSK